jgi:hypothetical protein
MSGSHSRRADGKPIAWELALALTVGVTAEMVLQRVADAHGLTAKRVGPADAAAERGPANGDFYGLCRWAGELLAAIARWDGGSSIMGTVTKGQVQGESMTGAGQAHNHAGKGVAQGARCQRQDLTSLGQIFASA